MVYPGSAGLATLPGYVRLGVYVLRTVALYDEKVVAACQRGVRRGIVDLSESAV